MADSSSSSGRQPKVAADEAVALWSLTLRLERAADDIAGAWESCRVLATSVVVVLVVPRSRGQQRRRHQSVSSKRLTALWVVERRASARRSLHHSYPSLLPLLPPAHLQQTSQPSPLLLLMYRPHSARLSFNPHLQWLRHRKGQQHLQRRARTLRRLLRIERWRARRAPLMSKWSPRALAPSAPVRDLLDPTYGSREMRIGSRNLMRHNLTGACEMFHRAEARSG